jgi:hypothetical protein
MIFKKYGHELSKVGKIGNLFCTCASNPAMAQAAPTPNYAAMPLAGSQPQGTQATQPPTYNFQPQPVIYGHKSTGFITRSGQRGTVIWNVGGDSIGCPIHDRKTGYFHKLSRRLTNYVLEAVGKPTKNERWFEKTKKSRNKVTCELL